MDMDENNNYSDLLAKMEDDLKRASTAGDPPPNEPSQNDPPKSESPEPAQSEASAAPRFGTPSWANPPVNEEVPAAADASAAAPPAEEAKPAAPVVPVTPPPAEEAKSDAPAAPVTSSPAEEAKPAAPMTPTPAASPSWSATAPNAAKPATPAPSWANPPAAPSGQAAPVPPAPSARTQPSAAPVYAATPQQQPAWAAPAPGYYAPYPYTPPAPAKKKGHGGTVVLIIVLLAVLGAIVYGCWRLSQALQTFQTGSETITYPVEPYVGVIYVEGTIQGTDPYAELLGGSYSYNHNFTMNAVNQLISDPNNKGIMLYIDSPGGTVFHTDELYIKLMEYKEKTGRPIYAYFGSMACSGGYYLGMAADKIIVNRNSLTGSIGVTMGVIVDATEYYEREGLKITPIYIGKNKTMGSEFEPLTDEQKEIFLSLAQESYDQFVGIVAQGRDKSVDEIIELADGRIYTPKQAKENGLVDEIGFYEDAISAMIDDKRDDDIDEFILFYDVLYQAPPLITTLFGQETGAKAPEDLAAALTERACPVAGPAYYYNPYTK